MSDYPRGKSRVEFFKAPPGGFQAEPNTKLPHVHVPHDGAIVEVSADLALKLVELGRARIVGTPQPGVAEVEVEVEPTVEAVVPKAESRSKSRRRNRAVTTGLK